MAVIKYNKSEIMGRAWKLYKAQDIRTMEVFAECMRQSWNIAKNGHAVNTIETVYAEHRDSIYNFILNKVGRNTHVAEELTNDVFVKFKQRISYDVYKAKINTLLFVIAKNVVIDYYRTNHQDHYKPVGDYVDADGKELFSFGSGEQANDMVENKEMRGEIMKAFNNLKPQHKAIATMFFVEQKTYPEIADALAMPLGSVKGTLSRIRGVLQNDLKALRQKA